MNWFKMQAIELGLSFVIGPLAAVTMQLLKQVVAAVELMPAWQKRAVVVAIASVFTLLGQALGVDFGVTTESVTWLAELSEDTIKVAIASAVAFALHWLKKRAGK